MMNRWSDRGPAALLEDKTTARCQTAPRRSGATDPDFCRRHMNYTVARAGCKIPVPARFNGTDYPIVPDQ